MLIRMLVDTVSKDGNLLLNVGPNARGEFEPRAIERLADIGEWMRLHGRVDLRLRRQRLHAAARLPLHPERQPALPPPLRLALPPRASAGLGDRVEYAQLLNDASEVKMRVIDPHQAAQNTTMGGLGDRHADAGTAGAEAGRGGAGGRAVLEGVRRTA